MKSVVSSTIPFVVGEMPGANNRTLTESNDAAFGRADVCGKARRQRAGAEQSPAGDWHAAGFADA